MFAQHGIAAERLRFAGRSPRHEQLAAYRQVDIALAADLPRLTGLRQKLRAQLLNSPLCDGADFTRDLESAYRQMWKKWCHSQHRSSK